MNRHRISPPQRLTTCPHPCRYGQRIARTIGAKNSEMMVFAGIGKQPLILLPDRGEDLSSNGSQCLDRLSKPRGQGKVTIKGRLMDILGFTALTITGFTSCAEFGSYAFVHPVIRRLPQEHHIRVEQGLLKTFGRVMPVLMPLCVILGVSYAVSLNSMEAQRGPFAGYRRVHLLPRWYRRSFSTYPLIWLRGGGTPTIRPRIGKRQGTVGSSFKVCGPGCFSLGSCSCVRL